MSNWFNIKDGKPEDDVMVWIYTSRGEMRIAKYRRSMDGRDLNGRMCDGWSSDEIYYGKVELWTPVQIPEKPIPFYDEERNALAVLEAERYNSMARLEFIKCKFPDAYDALVKEFETVETGVAILKTGE